MNKCFLIACGCHRFSPFMCTTQYALLPTPGGKAQRQHRKALTGKSSHSCTLLEIDKSISTIALRDMSMAPSLLCAAMLTTAKSCCTNKIACNTSQELFKHAQHVQEEALTGR